MRVYPKIEEVEGVKFFLIYDKEGILLASKPLREDSPYTYLDYDGLTYVGDGNGEVFVKYDSLIEKFK